MNKAKSIHEPSGLEYTEKDDFGQQPILAIGLRRHIPAIRVFADKQGELFAMLYGVAGSCGFSSWTNKPFVGALRRLSIRVYCNSDNGAFAVKVGDVATIAEELLTLPRAESLVTADDAFISITSKTKMFLDWWNNKALVSIEKQVRPKLIFLPVKTVTDNDKGAAEATFDDTEEAFLRFPYDKLTSLGSELKALIYQIRPLIKAGLPRDVAIRVAINLRKDLLKYDRGAALSNYAPIEQIVKFFNPRAVAIKLDLDLEESIDE